MIYEKTEEALVEMILCNQIAYSYTHDIIGAHASRGGAANSPWLVQYLVFSYYSIEILLMLVRLQLLVRCYSTGSTSPSSASACIATATNDGGPILNQALAVTGCA
jgi:hypothetical protein